MHHSTSFQHLYGEGLLEQPGRNTFQVSSRLARDMDSAEEVILGDDTIHVQREVFVTNENSAGTRSSKK